MADYVAIRQFPAERDGQTVIVLAGACFPVTDPIVKQHSSMFAPVKAKRSRKREAER